MSRTSRVRAPVRTRSVDFGTVGHRARLGLLCAGFVVGNLGCDKFLGQDDEEKPQWTRPSPATDAPEGDEVQPQTKPETPDAPAEPPRPIERAETKLYFPAKASTNFGFNLEALSELRALAGDIEAPQWSAASDDDPALARDDDISTAWRCTPNADAHCALGLTLPRPVRLKALRVYAASASTGRDARDQTRPTKVRVHTDEGFVDVPLPDPVRENAFTHLYIVLGQHVSTRAVALEVLETRGNKGPIHLAELEVYADDGKPREPWNIDPARTFVRVDADPWTKASGAWQLRSGVLEVVESDGSVRGLMAGTALVGKVGDRMLLLERIAHTQCTAHEGTFFLVDQHTRVIAPLGALGGAGAEIYRHALGLGFAVGRNTEVETTLHGVVLEEHEYRRKRTPARRDQRAPDTFEAWNFDTEPVRRGGAGPDDLPRGCVLGSDDLMAELSSALGRRAFETHPGQWVVCDLGDDTKAYMTARAPCGKKYELHVIDVPKPDEDERTKVVVSREGSGKGTYLRLERPAPDLVLAEIGQSNGQAEVFRMTPEAISSLGKGTALALRPPPACRKTCDDALANPHERGR
jgi:hypothetical protein